MKLINTKGKAEHIAELQLSDDEVIETINFLSQQLLDKSGTYTIYIFESDSGEHKQEKMKN